MADRDVDVLIVGGGLAGASTAPAALREEGFDGSILLVGREPTRPTSARRARRATCSGEESSARTRCSAPDEWWEEQTSSC